jgi:uncharacterized protein YjiS (DUF1127 family)
MSASMFPFTPSEGGPRRILPGQARRVPAAGAWPGIAVRATWLGWLREALRRRRTRRLLAELDDRMLRDIGVSRDEAEYESNKPFWLP